MFAADAVGAKLAIAGAILVLVLTIRLVRYLATR